MVPRLLVTRSEDSVTFGEVAVDLCQDAWASLDPARKILDRDNMLESVCNMASVGPAAHWGLAGTAED